MFEKNALGKNAKTMKIQHSNTTLKIIAAVLTAIGTIGVAILQNGVMNIDSYSTKTLLEAFNNNGKVLGLATAVIFCAAISSFALPVYSLILMEGYKHTSSFKNYVIRIAVMAVVSEIPYNLAMRDKWFDVNSQNPMFAVLIALLMIYFLDYFDTVKKIKGILLKIFIVLAALAWTIFTVADGGVIFVLLTAVLWLLAGNGAFTTFMGVVVSVLQFPAPFGFIFNHFYNGEKGKVNRWVFYIFYPAHLLILGLIGKYLL